MVIDILALLKQELLLSVIIIVMLIIKIGADEWKTSNLLNVINVLLLINFSAGFVLNLEGSLFNGMFNTNRLIILEKNILNLATLIISLQSFNWLKEHKHVIEFYVLMLCTLLGMFFMISSGNLLIFYVGLEVSTIPLAAMANFDLARRQSSEAAFKFIISSAFSSGLLLFGISLMYGATGSLDFEIIRQTLNGSSMQLFAFILLLSGFAFKISVVPFHLWTADVYEGAPVAVTSYLSVVSKASILFVFVPVLYTVFKSLAGSWYLMLFLLSILTMVIGNLFAIRQNNLKRLLAFSSISQVGFILVGISGSSQAGSASVIYFVLIYTLSNLGAFGVVSFISALTGKESIDDYKGLYTTNPLLSWVLAIALFSLAGIPPTAGFFGKFFLLMAGAGRGNYELIVIAAINMVVALYYYLRVIKAIFMESNEHPIEKLKISLLPRLAMLLCAGGIIITGFIGWLYDYIFSLSTRF
jgi:NADH-quinone oxidoreductase subunit N